MKKNSYPCSYGGVGIGLRLLSDDDKQHLHSAVLEILNTIGIKFECDEALDYLEKAGATIDRKQCVAKVPEYMVNEAISTAPGHYILYGKKPEYDVTVGDGRVNFLPFGSGIMVQDLKTGEVRDSTKADIVDCARIIESLDAYDVCMETLVPRDVDPKVASLHSFAAHNFHTNKNVTCGPADKRSAEALVEMAAIIAGGLEQLAARPFFNFGGCSISPLTIPDSTCQAIMAGARYHVPCGCLSMALAGGTSPVTLTGTVAMALAETLAAVVLSQSVKKGAEMLIGTSCCALDLRHNAAAMVGTPELALISAAFSEMANYYQIPCIAAGT